MRAIPFAYGCLQAGDRPAGALMDEALRAALARMSIFRTSSDAVVAFARDDFSILTLNPATEEMFGHHGTDLLGKSIELLVGDGSGLPADALDGAARELFARRADGS